MSVAEIEMRTYIHIQKKNKTKAGQSSTSRRRAEASSPHGRKRRALTRLVEGAGEPQRGNERRATFLRGARELAAGPSFASRWERRESDDRRERRRPPKSAPAERRRPRQ